MEKPQIETLMQDEPIMWEAFFDLAVARLGEVNAVAPLNAVEAKHVRALVQ